MPSNGESNSAEISAEIPMGTGDISLSIQKPGSSNHILGPNGWQSADYWFNGTPSEFSNDNVAWFSLPAQLVSHITYSNYSVFCRRSGNSTQIRTILTGGAMVAKPVHVSLPTGDIELPPLPTDFSQATLGSLSAVDEVGSAPQISFLQSEAVSSLPTAKPKVASRSAENVSASSAAVNAAVFDTSMAKQAPVSTTQQPRFDNNHPILFGLLAFTLLVIAVYFFGFRNTSVNEGANNAQIPVVTMQPETPLKTAPESSPETPPAKPEMPTKDESKIVESKTPEVKQGPKNLPSSVTPEPTRTVPAPEKEKPPGPPVPDLNSMVKEILNK